MLKKKKEKKNPTHAPLLCVNANEKTARKNKDTIKAPIICCLMLLSFLNFFEARIKNKTMIGMTKSNQEPKKFGCPIVEKIRKVLEAGSYQLTKSNPKIWQKP